MPLGNGEIAVNFWIEGEGDAVFYVAKGDAWNEEARLLKIGRVRVQLWPNPFSAGTPFHQELDVANGEICVRAGRAGEQVRLRIATQAVAFLRSGHRIMTGLQIRITARTP